MAGFDPSTEVLGRASTACSGRRWRKPAPPHYGNTCAKSTALAADAVEHRNGLADGDAAFVRVGRPRELDGIRLTPTRRAHRHDIHKSGRRRRRRYSQGGAGHVRRVAPSGHALDGMLLAEGGRLGPGWAAVGDGLLPGAARGARPAPGSRPVLGESAGLPFARAAGVVELLLETFGTALPPVPVAGGAACVALVPPVSISSAHPGSLHSSCMGFLEPLDLPAALPSDGA